MTRGLIGVLLSGRGSNFKAILEGCRRGEIPGTIGIVISDNPNAQGLEIARQAGIPAVVCGPGSMEQGHKPDEFVSVEQMAACDRLMDRLAEYLSNNG